MSDRSEVPDNATNPGADWEAPTIEEIDYAQTEASYTPGTADAAIYTN